MSPVFHGRDTFGDTCPSCFAQVERRDGPRYVEAVTGGRAIREWATVLWLFSGGRPNAAERQRGIPEGWFTRPAVGADSTMGGGS